MPKVLISDTLDSVAEKILLSNKIKVDVQTNFTEEQLIQKVSNYDGLIVRSATKVTKEVISGAKNLKIIGRAGAGVDNIDLKAAKEKDIIVMNTPGGNTNATAEHTLALLLSLSRKIPMADLTTHKGLWAKKKLKGNEIKGKTIGIIGFGNVGKRFAEMCSALGLNVIIYSKYFQSIKNEFPSYKTTDLNSLLKESDIISFHCKPNSDGSPIVGSRELGMMKNNAFIINTARGNLVSESDLSAALKNNTIKGAAFDVFENEPATDNVLFGLENVVLSPHIAASTNEAQVIVAEMIANQFCDYFNKNEINNSVN
ncbi:MAG: Hydroxypyruvate reductase [Alphaproteobacteria bacterium MarineAlpha5_Bin8]|nr:MAG: Hydroxypyruvate reductase [Alphaproteobacteria bacterium MarineAlpha5_Bin8]PPR45285.1 MAG: Hydroxypyruvate reductase [Alphaproteobacteria bacterium MarineAlpha5_Bin7]PPR53469.1 MAG: Hydroxypyruvate reductase [Alphaproteobacteria bacterium MarineAlpha5_Bin6]|tara:strand:- start:2363 stop:3301 length:939 start_codon:yes stop_codon:yes gene_type:complete